MERVNGKLSVIIPTHNPRPAYLQRVLDALKAQSLPKEEWELVLVDNASKEPVAERWDLSWHPNGRHVREETLGAAQARLRGIRETNTEWLVFVDDDNVLDKDYLREAVKAGQTHDFLGVIGGRIDPEFEEGNRRNGRGGSGVIWRCGRWNVRSGRICGRITRRFQWARVFACDEAWWRRICGTWKRTVRR